MIGCLTETTTCVVAKPLVYIKVKKDDTCLTTFDPRLHIDWISICNCDLFLTKGYPFNLYHIATRCLLAVLIWLYFFLFAPYWSWDGFRPKKIQIWDPVFPKIRKN